MTDDLLTRLTHAKAALVFLARLALPVSPQAAVYLAQAQDKIEAAMQQLRIEAKVA